MYRCKNCNITFAHKNAKGVVEENGVLYCESCGEPLQEEAVSNQGGNNPLLGETSRAVLNSTTDNRIIKDSNNTTTTNIYNGPVEEKQQTKYGLFPRSNVRYCHSCSEFVPFHKYDEEVGLCYDCVEHKIQHEAEALAEIERFEDAINLLKRLEEKRGMLNDKFNRYIGVWYTRLNNWEMAAKYFAVSKATEPIAVYGLGLYYYKFAKKQDVKKAMKFFEEAAEKGNAEAKNAIRIIEEEKRRKQEQEMREKEMQRKREEKRKADEIAAKKEEEARREQLRREKERQEKEDEEINGLFYCIVFALLIPVIMFIYMGEIFQQAFNIVNAIVLWGMTVFVFCVLLMLMYFIGTEGLNIPDFMKKKYLYKLLEKYYSYKKKSIEKGSSYTISTLESVISDGIPWTVLLMTCIFLFFLPFCSFDSFFSIYFFSFYFVGVSYILVWVFRDCFYVIFDFSFIFTLLIDIFIISSISLISSAIIFLMQIVLYH